MEAKCLGALHGRLCVLLTTTTTKRVTLAFSAIIWRCRKHQKLRDFRRRGTTAAPGTSSTIGGGCTSSWRRRGRDWILGIVVAVAFEQRAAQSGSGREGVFEARDHKLGFLVAVIRQDRQNASAIVFDDIEADNVACVSAAHHDNRFAILVFLTQFLRGALLPCEPPGAGIKDRFWCEDGRRATGFDARARGIDVVATPRHSAYTPLSSSAKKRPRASSAI